MFINTFVYLILFIYMWVFFGGAVPAACGNSWHRAKLVPQWQPWILNPLHQKRTPCICCPDEWIMLFYCVYQVTVTRVAQRILKKLTKNWSHGRVGTRMAPGISAVRTLSSLRALLSGDSASAARCFWVSQLQIQIWFPWLNHMPASVARVPGTVAWRWAVLQRVGERPIARRKGEETCWEAKKNLGL